MGYAILTSDRMCLSNYTFVPVNRRQGWEPPAGERVKKSEIRNQKSAISNLKSVPRTSYIQ